MLQNSLEGNILVHLVIISFKLLLSFLTAPEKITSTDCFSSDFLCYHKTLTKMGTYNVYLCKLFI